MKKSPSFAARWLYVPLFCLVLNFSGKKKKIKIFLFFAVIAQIASMSKNGPQISV